MKKYIKNKLKNNKKIYAYICIGDFSNCYEHINHNYLFKILKNFFDNINNFEFIYLFKRSFRLYNKNLNNSFLSYYPVNVKSFGLHYIRNLRELIIKSHLNDNHHFLLNQMFKTKSKSDLYIFADSYKSLQVDKRDIFMTIITVIRYYYLNIYFSIKEFKLNRKNIFYFQIFQENQMKGVYLSVRDKKRVENIKKWYLNSMKKINHDEILESLKNSSININNKNFMICTNHEQDTEEKGNTQNKEKHDIYIGPIYNNSFDSTTTTHSSNNYKGNNIHVSGGL
ncbi:hypothetical protein PFLG_03168 [Plasmodium falciparum RAJ116]|uniref:Telomerase reverse transcriptase n=1 Tax=Plasmodium falciparum RAJ116 TaxID=580058 RepID=A0A0L0D0V0_PLAFA|nr:hypothetical protein PFLG_03168 [Plasmodium falciparum RAJ116]